MAAGRRLRLKLKYSTRRTSSSSSSARPHMNSNTMDTGSDIIMQSPTTNAPQLMSSPLPFDPNIRLPNRITIPLAPAMTDTARRRRLSKGGTGAGIKRSASTPNIRKITQRDSAMSLADKRRSKLGYHRTSVACGRFSTDIHSLDVMIPTNSTINSTLPETKDPVPVGTR